MPQVVVRLDDDLAGQVDRLVEAGVAVSRSDAIRRALRALIEAERRRAVGVAIVEGYRRRPQTDDDLGWGDEVTRAMIAEEPW